MPSRQFLERSESHGVTVARLLERHVGEGTDIEIWWDELSQLVDDHDGRNLVLDFSSVEFFSSAGLGRLVSLQRKVKTHHGAMQIRCVRPEVQRLFAITRLDRLFDIKSDEVDAMAANG